MKSKCLSIVSPSGTKIAKGEKTIEVRSWKPKLKEAEDLLIIENQRFLRVLRLVLHRVLRESGDTDNDGKSVALVKIKKVQEFKKQDIPAACASR